MSDYDDERLFYLLNLNVITSSVFFLDLIIEINEKIQNIFLVFNLFYFSIRVSNKNEFSLAILFSLIFY